MPHVISTLAKKLRLCHPVHHYNEYEHRQAIRRGYPITRYPVIPDILMKAVDFKVIKDDARRAVLGFVLARPDSDLVNPKSKEFIRQYLADYFSHGVTEQLKPFPENVIAVSLSTQSFEVGKAAQEFHLQEEHRAASADDVSYFTYQQLSENLQVTFYHENGVEYTAGFCYYLTPRERRCVLPKWHKDLFTECTGGAVPYPLCRRDDCKYGRRCGEVGRHVIVELKYGEAFHKTFDHHNKKNSLARCAECTVDAENYNWKQQLAESEELNAVTTPFSDSCKADPQISQLISSAMLEDGTSSESEQITSLEDTSIAEFIRSQMVAHGTALTSEIVRNLKSDVDDFVKVEMYDLE